MLIVLVIAASSALAAFEAVTRLAHPHPVSNLVAVAIAALIGFTGKGVIARYGIGVGRRIRSAALVVLSGTDFAPFLMRQASCSISGTIESRRAAVTSMQPDCYQPQKTRHQTP